MRGAPAIGVTGAYGVALAAAEALRSVAPEMQQGFLSEALEELACARPTAINLRWAVNRLKGLLQGSPLITEELVAKLVSEAKRIHSEDIENNRRIAKLGATFLKNCKSVLTYCNTGDLATGGIGTAFGIIHQSYLLGQLEGVYACETRPVLQGARLTAWELMRNGIPFKLICDNMAASLMAQKAVQAVVVGADRVAANGDATNKIGTYGLAVLAHHHKIPFVVAAPCSTFDLTLVSGDEVPIEERGREEVISLLGESSFSQAVSVFNPAFDTTPAALISALVCELGVIEAPTQEKVETLLRQSLGRESLLV